MLGERVSRGYGGVCSRAFQLSPTLSGTPQAGVGAESVVGQVGILPRIAASRKRCRKLAAVGRAQRAPPIGRQVINLPTLLQPPPTCGCAESPQCAKKQLDRRTTRFGVNVREKSFGEAPADRRRRSWNGKLRRPGAARIGWRQAGRPIAHCLDGRKDAFQNR
jgi:hypothetical protein